MKLFLKGFVAVAVIAVFGPFIGLWMVFKKLVEGEQRDTDGIDWLDKPIPVPRPDRVSDES